MSQLTTRVPPGGGTDYRCRFAWHEMDPAALVAYARDGCFEDRMAVLMNPHAPPDMREGVQNQSHIL